MSKSSFETVEVKQEYSSRKFENQIFHRLDLQKLREAMQQLNDEERRLIEMYYWDEMTMQEIADVFGMQCRHSVFSMGHRVDGRLTINGKEMLFCDGMGYIEGDCGNSFPERYIWTQCSFPDGSVMLSVADIPMYGLHFTGIIGVVMLNGKEHRIATYLGARVQHIGRNTVTLRQGDYVLIAKLLTKNAHSLLAPYHGNMSRTIHENASCKACYRFSHKEKMLCEFTNDRASFEFEYQ